MDCIQHRVFNETAIIDPFPCIGMSLTTTSFTTGPCVNHRQSSAVAVAPIADAQPRLLDYICDGKKELMHKYTTIDRS